MRLEQRARSFRRTPASPLACLAAALAGLAGTAAQAACGATATPGTGQSVVCVGATTGSASVIAAPGSTGVAITVDSGATLTTNATQALLVRDASSITIIRPLTTRSTDRRSFASAIQRLPTRELPWNKPREDRASLPQAPSSIPKAAIRNAGWSTRAWCPAGRGE